MYFTAATVLALAASVVAQTAGFDPIVKPGQSETIAAGSTYEIDWEATAEYPGTVTLTLIGGANPQSLNDIAVLAKSVDNTLESFSWTVDSTLGSLATYGIRINWDTDSTIFQYSFPFVISGGSTKSASASGTASATASATATSAGSVLISSSSVSANVTSTTVIDEVTVSALCTTTTPASNLSTTATNLPGHTTITSIFTPVVSKPATKTSAVPSTVPTSGASAIVGSSVAMLGAFVAAIFAL